MEIFDRQASIDIGEPGQQGVRVEGVRILFNVKKTITQTSNTANIEISNLSENTRAAIKEVDTLVILRAGYGDDTPILAIGNVMSVSHDNTPPNVTTKITIGDGLKARREIRVSLSFESGATGRQILNEVVKKMGLVSRELPQIANKPFEQGFSYVGQAKGALDEIANALNLEWSIQNNEMLLLPSGEAAPVQAIVVSPESGMIGSPEPVADVAQNLSGNAVNRGMKIETLLQPRMEPGGVVEIRSRNVNGFYRVEACEHSGDTEGGDWKTTAQLKER